MPAPRAQDDVAGELDDKLLLNGGKGEALAEQEQAGGIAAGVVRPAELSEDPPDVDYSSVVTQVTHAGPSYRAAPLRLEQQRAAQQRGWGWLRTALCCFMPSSSGYIKQERDGPVAIRSMPPPIPPRQLRDGFIIGPSQEGDKHKKCLVLDLDETLVHSSFKPIPNPDYIIPVEIDGKMVDVYVLKRPWLDHFMDSIGQRFEVVVFTASLSKYADPLLDLLDKSNVVRWRLFRESCMPYEGNYVKDLSCLGRDLANTIIVDNSPHSYVFQPSNAMPISTFIDNMEDQELLELLPLLAQVEYADDVRPILGMQQQQALQQQRRRFMHC